MAPTNVMVLASGRGTDFQAILDHERLGVLLGVKLSLLVCNHINAQVIRRAESAGVKSIYIEGVAGRKFGNPEERELARESFDKQCIEKIEELGVDLVVLAGFDQIISKHFVGACKFKIINIHPAYDISRFGGKNMVGKSVHQLVLSSGVRYSGCSVHFVTEALDLGPVILKKSVEIFPGDDAEALEMRVLEKEHLAYPEAIQLLTDGRVIIDEPANRCYVDRYSDDWDIQWNARQQKYIEYAQSAAE